MPKFGFHDLHSFKDYAVYVHLYSPDEYPVYEWLAPEDRLTLDSAFEGLRMGLDLAEKEKGALPAFVACRKIADEAYANYRAGKAREGFLKMEELIKIINRIPSQ